MTPLLLTAKLLLAATTCAYRRLTSFDRRTKYVRIFAVIIAELKLGNIQRRHVFFADFVEAAIDVTSTWAVGNNSFTVSGGVLTVADFYACSSSSCSGVFQLNLGDLTPAYALFLEGGGPSGEVAATTASFAPAGTPLPAALPLFGTGLGVMGLFGWLRKRKTASAIAVA
jgi:hypothetical protein